MSRQSKDYFHWIIYSMVQLICGFIKTDWIILLKFRSKFATKKNDFIIIWDGFDKTISKTTKNTNADRFVKTSIYQILVFSNTETNLLTKPSLFYNYNPPPPL